MVENLKFLLLDFESLSGLKINLDKSALVAFNISNDLASSLAQQLGCTLTSLPIMYLGVPLHWKQLSVFDWSPLVDKIEKKITNLER